MEDGKVDDEKIIFPVPHDCFYSLLKVVFLGLHHGNVFKTLANFEFIEMQDILTCLHLGLYLVT